ncbi:hypothetical protein ARMGADRAFT_1086266 [Armillaria gallica]|uniref:Uncharacterized protein n=1 Tax=Armillaria gallica TaxID=47427 RepID=A0A2H3CY56_ARMGA|nr:hypothetical protein ARMGADRAFT_1086266 [Armillaria gallica]
MPSPAVDGLSNATATRPQVTNTSSRWYYAILMAIPLLRSSFLGLTMTQEKCISRLRSGQVISPFNIAILVADSARWRFQCAGKVHVTFSVVLPLSVLTSYRFPSDRGADFNYACILQDGSTLSNLQAVCAGDTTCYVLKAMLGLCSLFAGDKMAGTGNRGFGFAVDYRFLPCSRPRRSVEDACAPRKLPMLVAHGRLKSSSNSRLQFGTTFRLRTVIIPNVNLHAKADPCAPSFCCALVRGDAKRWLSRPFGWTWTVRWKTALVLDEVNGRENFLGV